ncbi:MAG: hypothetical protein IKK58_06315 [Clostridia bacterium]|nr:hypothetical protein [Clostridia bacterium]
MKKNMLDIAHRKLCAMNGVKETTTDHTEYINSLLTASGSEVYDASFRICKIKTDWISRIEETLPKIQRAIDENRQFILSEGETVIIEKARRIKKSSVEHLARHSQFITKEPINDEITPEKIYVEENRSTFAVYENRFLYTLICYIRDFTTIKKDKITKFSNSFNAHTVYDKEFSTNNKKVRIHLDYSEMASNCNDIGENEETVSAIKRMESILLICDSMLKTPLMMEVSAAPMIKGAVTRTNVLLHNPCFSAAAELYDYLCAYKGDGFEISQSRSVGAPDKKISLGHAELISLVSYLAYSRAGLNRGAEMRYDQQMAMERAKALKDLKSKLKRLRSEFSISNARLEKYVSELERYSSSLDLELETMRKDLELIPLAKERLAEAERISELAQNEKEELKRVILELEDRERNLKRNHQINLERCTAEVSQCKDALAAEGERHASELKKLTDDFKKAYSELEEKYYLLCAFDDADKLLKSDERPARYTREEFARLDAQYKAYKKYYLKQWKLAKKHIFLQVFKGNSDHHDKNTTS